MAESSALRVCIRDRQTRLEQNDEDNRTGCRRPTLCFAAELRGLSSRAAFYGDLTCSANRQLPWVLARLSQPSQESRRPIFLTPFPLACSFRADAMLRLGVLAYATTPGLDQREDGTRS